MSGKTKCEEVRGDLAAIVDGDAEVTRRHAEHMADCDECRDLRHAAVEAARRLADAGSDFKVPADLEARLAAAIDAAPRAAAADGPAASDAAEAGAAPADDRPARETRAGEAPADEAETGEARSREAAAAEGPARDAGRSPAARPAPARGRRELVWLVPAIAAAAGIAFLVTQGDPGGGAGTRAAPSGPSAAAAPERPGALSAKVVQVARAAEDKAGGVEARAPGAAGFSPADVGAALVAGATIRTDGRTRVRLELSDGSIVALNHRSEVTLAAGAARRVELASGELLADVAPLDAGPGAVFGFPGGHVEVLGTRFVLSSSPDQASVRVVRGRVRLVGKAGGVEVGAGEEGTLGAAGVAQVAPALDLAASVGWSELDEPGPDREAFLAGLGELRARKPGESQDRERPLALKHHKVTIRIAGNVARTEIEEVFANDGGDTLEGIYRFPLPPDARIARLALDVEGKLEEGAFVETARAAGIWRGVIRHATPKPKALAPREEIVWVPGPWRDPALLEWKRGGRFELKIFPIPARGERRVILAYTQTVPPQGERRRYVYPLAHSADRSTMVGRFEIDARVAGADEKTPVVARGYALTEAREEGATRLAFAHDGFLPAGDLAIDYALPGGGRELHYWTFRGDVAAGPGATAGTPGRKGAAEDPAILAAQREVAADGRPFVAFALRPRLAAAGEGKPREYRIVVDASQSMVGERWLRAGKLASSLVAQMDRRDRFLLLACDVECRALEGGVHAPSAQAAAQVTAWLAGIRPAGASDLAAALRLAAGWEVRSSAPDPSGAREVHVIYVGDGLASVGPRRAATLAAEAEDVARAARVAITTVGIGGDADAQALAAVARAGGGHYHPYRPGERVATAALAVLETTFGATLRDVTVEAPAGVTDLGPARLPNLRAGEEVIVAGRFDGPVSGDVIVRGTLDGKAFERRYPVALAVSTASGNAFVPRLWAAATIERLELDGRGEDRARIVALSKAYAVLSRQTSLLVLESEAMFKAFGVDRARPTLEWTGEEAEVEMGEAGEEVEASKQDAVFGAGPGGGGRAAGAGYAGLDAVASAPRKAPAAAASEAPDLGDEKAGAAPTERETRTLARRPRDRGEYMRRIWVQVGQVAGYAGPSGADVRRVEVAEEALQNAPDSRDRHRDLVRALARAGEIDRAIQTAEAWLGRDALDAEALSTLADLVARDGRRDEAVRLLSGVVDLSPDDRALHERLAASYDRIGAGERACAHRVALAEIDGADATAIGNAVRCERALGHGARADRVLAGLADSAARLRAEKAAQVPPAPAPVRGNLLVDASWSGGGDVDVTIVTPRGDRVSWMGGRAGISAEAVDSRALERLALRSVGTGTYLVEVSRTRPGDTARIAGDVQIRVLGVTRRVPFTLAGERATVARVDVRRESRLVPL